LLDAIRSLEFPKGAGQMEKNKEVGRKKTSKNLISEVNANVKNFLTVTRMQNK